ncbi:MAG: DUF1476 domain-containing protein [Alphaproteobacteria bacterium]
MSKFDDREKAFESKYGRDQENEFKIVARRNKLLGLWVAEKLGKTGEAAESYAKEVVTADFEEVGHDDVVRKIMADLNSAGIDLSEHLVRSEMDKLLLVARQQIETGS